MWKNFNNYVHKYWIPRISHKFRAKLKTSICVISEKITYSLLQTYKKFSEKFALLGYHEFCTNLEKLFANLLLTYK